MTAVGKTQRKLWTRKKPEKSEGKSWRATKSFGEGRAERKKKRNGLGGLWLKRGRARKKE